jgi:hypothetical protein
MQITKVQYGKTYSLGNYCSERIDLEASIDETHESVTDAVFQLREYCDQLHKKNNPHLYQEQTPEQREVIHAPPYNTYPPEGISEPPEKIPQEQKIQNLISQATSLPELKQWELLSKSNEKLKEAYEKRLLELSE